MRPEPPRPNGPADGARDRHMLHARDAEREGRVEVALASYREATRLWPDYIPARLHQARLLRDLGRTDAAMAAYTALLKRSADDQAALRDLFWLQGNRHDFEGALKTLARMDALGAETAREKAELLLGLMSTCRWAATAELIAGLAARLQSGQPCLVNPFALLASLDRPDIHLHMARCIAQSLSSRRKDGAKPEAPGRRIARAARDRPRIGYLSGDFRQSAMSLLMVEVLENHDRDRYDITLYDYSEDDASPARRRITGAGAHVVQLPATGPAACAARIAADDVDILIDLKGYTDGTRSELLMFRPAPVQVNFLGYPGTQGAAWIDYVLADSHVLPFSEAGHWQERIVHLPGCYYPNGRNRGIPRPRAPRDRAAHGLPEDAFVFACFNNPYKITPDVFAVWMRLLRALPRAVLWLWSDNAFAPDNLRLEAGRHGVAPDRLVFAGPAPFEAHLARYPVADLFLDTAPYNAHTIAADALWAALPVVTVTGKSFASRVGASLLHAVGLPDLICQDLESYAALAQALARDPQRLADLRAHLITCRDTAPLFDPARFARGLERAYTEMARINRNGGPPEPISL